MVSLRRSYNGHPKRIIDRWFLPCEDLSRYDPEKFFFDPEAVENVIEFFTRYLRHVKGEWAGQPLLLENWEFQIVRDLFGWKRRSNGTRKHRSCYVEVPRKNGKSTLAAGIGLYMTFADKEPGAEVYSAAADRKQAAIVFDSASQMVKASPDLLRRSEVFRQSIYIQRTSSVYRVLSSDVPTKHGLNVQCVVFDELHVQPNRNLWDVLTTSTASRRQPIIYAMTTAGYDRHSLGWEVHDYAIKVRDGIIRDDTMLVVIFAATEQDDWTDPKVWRKANPNYGISVKPEYLDQEFRRAREIPAYQDTFKRLHLNIWTQQIEKALPMEKWRACPAQSLHMDLKGKPCWAGLDLSSTTDLTALSLVFAPDGDRYHTLHRFWVPEESLAQRVKRDRVPYDVWAKEGWITVTPGNVVDYRRVREDIIALGKLYNIREIAIDRWNATGLAIELQDEGFTIVLHGQGFRDMAMPTKEWMRLVLSKQLDHGGNPVLEWNVSNAVLEQDPAGNLKPNKAKSTDRIDGLIALIMAIGRANLQTQAPKPSIYETRGVRSI